VVFSHASKNENWEAVMKITKTTHLKKDGMLGFLIGGIE
jgi:hypothetical protein